MRKKRNKLICVLIILLVFFSGMYFDNFKVDARFMCPSVETANSGISPVTPVFSGVQACTAEMLGIRGSEGLGQFIRFATQRRETRKPPELLCPNIFFPNEGKSYTDLEEVLSVSKNQDELITSYIHKSDGKK